MRWTVETLDPVDAEIMALPVGLQARVLRLLEAIENVGLEQLREPHVRHLEGKLWELRAKAQEGLLAASTSPFPVGGWSCSTSSSRRRRRRPGERCR